MNIRSAEMRGNYHNSLWENAPNAQNIWINIKEGGKQQYCPLLIQGGRQIISEEFLKGAIIWLYDAMTLDEKIRLNTYTINGIRNK